MKKIIISFFALLLIAGCSPPELDKSALVILPFDVAEEEEAIKAMLKKEVDLFWSGDLIAESEFWIKEDYLTVVNTGSNNHWQARSYDTIYAVTKSQQDVDWRPDVTDIEIEYTDVHIKIYGSVAWAVYYMRLSSIYKGEPYVGGMSVRTTFLEKVDGKWKIALNHTAGLNPCEKEEYQVQKQYLQEK